MEAARAVRDDAFELLGGVLGLAVEERIADLLRQVAVRLFRVHVEVAAELLQDVMEIDRHAPAAAPPDVHGALAQAQVLVRDDEVRVELQARAEPVARRAGAVRAVEREHVRLELFVADAAVRAGVPLAVERVGPALLHLAADDERAVGELQRGLDGIGQPRFDPGLQREPVHDHVNVVLLVLRERGDAGEVHDHAVHAHAHEALGLDPAEDVGMLALAAADHRREEHDPPAFPGAAFEDRAHDLLGGLLRDRPAALVAIRRAAARVEQPQEIVNLRRRRDGRARAGGAGALLDGDRRRQALDGLDGRFLHLLEELPRVGGEALDVPALALGEDRVERQRGFPGTAQAGEDDELVARDGDGEVLEVVFLRAADDDLPETLGGRGGGRVVLSGRGHGNGSSSTGAAFASRRRASRTSAAMRSASDSADGKISSARMRSTNWTSISCP